VLRTEGCGVLVVNPEHLSPSPPVRRAIEVEIDVLGSRVLTVTATAPVEGAATPAADLIPGQRPA
jgi:hypothetical protein